MPAKIVCSFCGVLIKVSNQLQGGWVKCISCGTKNDVNAHAAQWSAEDDSTVNDSLLLSQEERNSSTPDSEPLSPARLRDPSFPDFTKRQVSEKSTTRTGPRGIQSRPPGSTADGYPAILTYAKIGRVIGWLTLVSAVIAGIGVGATLGGNGLIAFGVFFLGVVAGIGQLAFAELLELFVGLKADTQYMCERLYTLEQKTKPDNRP